MRYTYQENGLVLVFELEKGQPPVLLYLGAEDDPASVYANPREERRRHYNIQEVQAAGESRLEHFGTGMSGTLPGSRMEYLCHMEMETAYGKLLQIVSADPVTGLHSCMRYQFFTGIPVVRCENALTNQGVENITIEGVSAFIHTAMADDRQDDLVLMIPHNAWQEELQWREYPVYDLGFWNISEPGFSSKRIQLRASGSWSSGEYLPMGCLRNETAGTAEFWQIENNGPWTWEIQERDGKPSLLISGPNELDHSWYRTLKPQESFVTVPACIGFVQGGTDEAMAALTRYRRAIRRKNQDNRKLPIIFNDYMNCLFGDPTTEKELPIIDAAAAMGCEYYVIDAGWYTDENWWYKVGEWKPSAARFPGGFAEVTDYIRSKGMIPGLWVEIESMGSQCPLADQVPADWFLQRHGKPALDRDRYHLDFRNPQVRDYTRGVIDRLIRDYGIGYFKIDYNINAFTGTDYQADSPGDGLLSHTRAYLSWLDEIFRDYPDLVLENCGSGGMRMDYALLARYSIQSTSDQTDYRKYASIAANAPTAVTPEQAAVWCYPLADADMEQVIFNCVNAGLLRIHQSGHFGMLSEENRLIIRDFYAFYHRIREDIPHSLPFWPLGLAKEGDGQMALGLSLEEKALLAVWRLDGSAELKLPLPRYQGKSLSAAAAFPTADKKCRCSWDPEQGILSVTLPEENMARILEIRVI